MGQQSIRPVCLGADQYAPGSTFGDVQKPISPDQGEALSRAKLPLTETPLGEGSCCGTTLSELQAGEVYGRLRHPSR